MQVHRVLFCNALLRHSSNRNQNDFLGKRVHLCNALFWDQPVSACFEYKSVSDASIFATHEFCLLRRAFCNRRFFSAYSG